MGILLLTGGLHAWHRGAPCTTKKKRRILHILGYTSTGEIRRSASSIICRYSELFIWPKTAPSARTNHGNGYFGFRTNSYGKAGFSLGPKKTRRLCKSASGEYLYLYVENRRASGAARCRGVSWIEKKCPIMCPTIDSTIYFIRSLRVPWDIQRDVIGKECETSSS